VVEGLGTEAMMEDGMNKKRILELATVIERAPHHTSSLFDDGVVCSFSMSVWRCGTTACIGGWVETLHGEPHKLFHGSVGVAKVLGISYEQAEALCYPGALCIGLYEDITPAEAADTLRRLAATGKVEWKIERQDERALEVEHEPVRQMETA
jgi:hypothetical protein